MGRSLKKGPFVNAKLIKAIIDMNAANEKKVLKTWSRPSPRWWDIPSLFMTEKNMFPYTSLRTW